MHVTLFMAISLNGFVADEAGSEEFISDENWKMFCTLAREKGNFIIGRNTYEAVKTWGANYSFDDLKEVTKVIVTSDDSFSVPSEYILASSPQDALQKLSDKGFQSVLLGGGPTLNSAFTKEGLVDEVIFNIEPVIVGKGKSVFASEDFQKNLEFISTKELINGIVQVRYKVKK